MGQAGTLSGDSPQPLGELLGGTTVNWFASYGAPYLPEPPRTFQTKLDAAPPDTFGCITEDVQFVATKAPVIVAPRGANLTLSLNFQAWGSTSCPECPLQYVLAIPNYGPVLCLDHIEAAGSYPGKSFTSVGTINVPTLPGQYPLVAGLTAEPSCGSAVGTGPEIAQLFVQ